MSKHLMPISPDQIRALHAIAKRRGWDHAQLREAAGVASLKELSLVDAHALIDRLQFDDHRGRYTPPPPDRATARGTIRNATKRQRGYIASLFARLGWDAAKAAGWLERRHDITDLAGGVFSTAAAKDVVVQLESALAKGGSESLQDPLETPSNRA